MKKNIVETITWVEGTLDEARKNLSIDFKLPSYIPFEYIGKGPHLHNWSKFIKKDGGVDEENCVIYQNLQEKEVIRLCIKNNEYKEFSELKNNKKIKEVMISDSVIGFLETKDDITSISLIKDKLLYSCFYSSTKNHEYVVKELIEVVRSIK